MTINYCLFCSKSGADVESIYQNQFGRHICIECITSLNGFIDGGGGCVPINESRESLNNKVDELLEVGGFE